MGAGPEPRTFFLLGDGVPLLLGMPSVWLCCLTHQMMHSTFLWVLSVYSGNSDVKTLHLACKHLIKLRKKNKSHAYLKMSSCCQLNLTPKQYSSLNIYSESNVSNILCSSDLNLKALSRGRNFFKSDNNKFCGELLGGNVHGWMEAISHKVISSNGSLNQLHIFLF